MSRWLLPIIFFAVGVAIAFGVTLRSRSDDSRGGDWPSLASPRSHGVDESRRNAIVRAVERTGGSVVSIAVRRNTGAPGTDIPPDPWEDFFSRLFPSARRPSWDLGSGVIVDDAGHILTNEHVVRGVDYEGSPADIWVVLADGRFFDRSKVVVVGTDPYYDLAVLRIEGEEVGNMSADLGASSSLMVGEWVIAIGNPFGFYFSQPTPSVTVGVVSALRREISSDIQTAAGIYKNMIQTDAAINPGNSGGALVNAAGEVIGINTFLLSTSGGTGLGFAIPIDDAKRVLRDILEFGRVREPWLGLHYRDITPAIQQALGIRHQTGIVVADVEPGSPMERAGFKKYDVILRINNRRVDDGEDAFRAIHGTLIGETVLFGIERAGVAVEVPVTLEERRSDRRGGES